jgi:hypothetical protein
MQFIHFYTPSDVLPFLTLRFRWQLQNCTLNSRVLTRMICYAVVQRFSNCGARTRGWGGASCLCERHVYFEQNMDAT